MSKMRFVWTDAGDDPSWDAGDKHGINGYFMPMFDPLTTKAFLREEVKGRGHVPGIYLPHNLMAGVSADRVVRAMNEEYRRCLVPGLRVMGNFEDHEPEFIADVFEGWRNLNPFVPTSWSPEGMQGGWMSPEFVQRILACRIRIVPQGYWGSEGRIEGLWAEDQVLRDLMHAGFPENIISIFYHAAELPRDWDGYAFRMGLLPWP